MDQDHWRQFSKCKGSDLELFYPEKGVGGAAARKAKAICNGLDGRPECPVKRECLEFANSTETCDADRFGVFGGLTAYERSSQYRKRPRRRRMRSKCQQGHEYTPENTLYDAANRRVCRECKDRIPTVEEHGHRYVPWVDWAGDRRCKTCYDSQKRATSAARRERKAS